MVKGVNEGVRAYETVSASIRGVQFGRVENQIAHSGRHLLDEGIDPGSVQALIRADLTGRGVGGVFNGTVAIAGRIVDYVAHPVLGGPSMGMINLGRITVRIP